MELLSPLCIDTQLPTHTPPHTHTHHPTHCDTPHILRTRSHNHARIPVSKSRGWGPCGAAAENPWLLSWVREYDKGQTTIIKNWRIPRPLARKLDRFSCCACSSPPGVALVGKERFQSNYICEPTGAAEEDMYIRMGPPSFTTRGHWHLAQTAYASLRCRHIQNQRFDFFFKKRL